MSQPSVIRTPGRATWNARRRLSTLEWQHDGHPIVCHAYVRGGICWPIPVPDRGHDIEGFAIIAAQDTETGILTIYEEHPFAVIENVQDDQGRTVEEGAATAFARAWNAYRGDTFFHRTDPETHRRYVIEIGRSDNIRPEPHFILTHWERDAIPTQMLFEMLHLNRLRIAENGPLAQRLKSFTTDPRTEGQLPPELSAFFALLVGLRRIPYIAPPEEDEERFLTEAKRSW